MKKFWGLILGLVALGLLVPGIIMVFSITGGWNLAAILLAVFVLAAAVFSIIAAIFSIVGHKKASAMFLCAGIAAVLNLALTLFLALSFELTIITTALSIIILFIAAKVISSAGQ
jgi:hypothetical protein